MMHVGRPLGGELLGATVFEIEAGVPGIYHFHHGNEEWALVLDGTLTVRTPGRRASALARRRGGVPARRRRARMRSRTHRDRVCRVAVFSSMRDPDVIEYPDAGVVGAIAGDAPTAGRDAPFEAFFRLDSRVAGLLRDQRSPPGLTRPGPSTWIRSPDGASSIIWSVVWWMPKRSCSSPLDARAARGRGRIPAGPPRAR